MLIQVAHNASDSLSTTINLTFCHILIDDVLNLNLFYIFQIATNNNIFIFKIYYNW